ncbi:XRE family transcriptional regulator [Salinisphaera hydrothermalis]|uniref:XRE family transcriptional regulator n=1 Tax=Salinisphaera hydrothermalis TaxID=563188 RepID=UPI0033402B62
MGQVTTDLEQGAARRGGGPPEQSLYRAERERTLVVQARLREFDEILSYTAPRGGSKRKAFAWFQSRPLPSFGNRTAEALVKAGKASAVKVYLPRLNDGGFA